MKSFLLVLLIALSGCCCLSSDSKRLIAYQAARLDRAVALINSGGVTDQQAKDFIRAERKIWHALNFVENDIPLPLDLEVK
jgi:hypothetical protein